MMIWKIFYTLLMIPALVFALVFRCLAECVDTVNDWLYTVSKHWQR